MAANGARNLYRLYVGNVPWTIGHQELRQYFSKFGHVSQGVIVFDKKTGLSKNYGFVTFSNREGFETANNINRHTLEGNILAVQPSSQAVIDN